MPQFLEIFWALNILTLVIDWKLEQLDIQDNTLPLQALAQDLINTINEIKLSKANCQIVTGSKALHHILPNLIPPIDRAYTRPFFQFWMQQFQYNADVFPYIWKQFALIAQRTNPKQYVGKGDWATSITKVLDNAIVGYIRNNNLPRLT